MSFVLLILVYILSFSNCSFLCKLTSSQNVWDCSLPTPEGFVKAFAVHPLNLEHCYDRNISANTDHVANLNIYRKEDKEAHCHALAELFQCY